MCYYAPTQMHEYYKYPEYPYYMRRQGDVTTTALTVTIIHSTAHRGDDYMVEKDSIYVRLCRFLEWYCLNGPGAELFFFSFIHCVC